VSRTTEKTNLTKPESARSVTKQRPEKKPTPSPKKTPTRAEPQAITASDPTKSAPVKLLSGGNPQIAKGDGDAPVQAYIQAMPGWKKDAGRRLDTLITKTVPGVKKAVKWNSPFYGIEGQGWFVSYHCFNKYIKVTFFRGAALRPRPPVESKDKDARYFHIYEDDQPAETQIKSWLKQAAALPGWTP